MCVCRYATIYTMFPVFSLVLDQDVKPEMALLYPELYKDLTKVQWDYWHLLQTLSAVCGTFHSQLMLLCFRVVRYPSRPF